MYVHNIIYILCIVCLNVFQVLVLAQAHDLHDLAQRTLSFILCNLTEVMHRNEFTQLSKEMLVKIISSSQLELDSEAIIVKAVLIWVRANERQRNPFLHELLQHARLRSIDMQELEKMMLVRTPGPIQMELDGHGDLIHTSALDSLSVSPLPDRLTEVLVVVCRETERKHRGMIKDLSTLYFYDPEALRWEILTSLPFEDRQDYSAMVVNNILYLTGGQSMDINDIYCTKIVFNENWAYDPLLDKWEERQSMMVPR